MNKHIWIYKCTYLFILRIVRLFMWDTHCLIKNAINNNNKSEYLRQDFLADVISWNSYCFKADIFKILQEIKKIFVGVFISFLILLRIFSVSLWKNVISNYSWLLSETQRSKGKRDRNFTSSSFFESLRKFFPHTRAKKIYKETSRGGDTEWMVRFI